MPIRDQLQQIEIMMNEGQLDEAIETLEELSQNHPDNYHVISLLGECYLISGEPEKAIKPLRWATKTFHEYFKKFKKKAQESQRNDSDEKSLIRKLKKQQERRDENNVWVDHYLLGCAFGRCMQFRPAIRHLNIADKMNPKNAEIIRNIGWIRCMQEKQENGRQLLKEAINLDPENALAYNDLGASYMFEENFEEAQKWIKKAQDLDPDDDFIQTTADKLEELMAHHLLTKKTAKHT